MARIDHAYVALAIAYLVIGELLGFYMGITSNLQLRSLHITIVLVGFVTLAIFGCIYRLWPAMKAGPLAVVQFWLGVVGALGILIGTYQFVTTGGIAIVGPASALFILATILLGWLFWSRREAP